MKVALAFVVMTVLLAGANGCKSNANQAELKNAVDYVPAPARPFVPPPAFTVLHHDASSITLVTEEHASDEQIESLIWELRDAARVKGFDKIGVPQKVVDARDPIVWFHIYRGSKCASEKYTSGKLPCGASYHAAGEYTLGGFKDKDHDDGALLKDEEHEVHLW